MTSKKFLWNQPNGKVWTVETNTEKGYVKMYDESGKVALNEINLSPFSVKIVEESFLSIVAEEQKKFNDDYNLMYA